MGPDMSKVCCGCGNKVGPCDSCSTCNTGIHLDPTVYGVTGNCDVAYAIGQECELCTLFGGNFSTAPFIGSNSRSYIATSPLFNPGVSYLVEDEIAPTVPQTISYAYTILDGKENLGIEGAYSTINNLYTAQSIYNISSSASNGINFQNTPYTYNVTFANCGNASTINTSPLLDYFISNFNSGETLTISLTSNSQQNCEANVLTVIGGSAVLQNGCSNASIGLVALLVKNSTGINNWINFENNNYNGNIVLLSDTYKTFNNTYTYTPVTNINTVCPDNYFPPLNQGQLSSSCFFVQGGDGLGNYCFASNKQSVSFACCPNTFPPPNFVKANGTSVITFTSTECVKVALSYNGIPESINITLQDVNGNFIDPVGRFLKILLDTGYYTSCDGLSSL